MPFYRTYHLRQTSRSDYVACVNEAIQMTCRFLDRFSHVVFTIEVKYICDQI